MVQSKFQTFFKTFVLNCRYDSYIFSLGFTLNPPDFRIVEIISWWLERLVRKVSDILNRFFLLVKMRSMQVELLDWYQVGLFIKLLSS